MMQEEFSKTSCYTDVDWLFCFILRLIKLQNQQKPTCKINLQNQFAKLSMLITKKKLWLIASGYSL